MTTKEIQQLDEINFSVNWNNKLACRYFTTIRLGLFNKYKSGKLYRINLNDKYRFVAKCVEVNPIKMNEITSIMSLIDCSLYPSELKKMLLKMYRSDVIERLGLCIIVLEKQADTFYPNKNLLIGMDIKTN